MRRREGFSEAVWNLPVGRDRPPGGPGEWKVNVGPWMDSRAFYGWIHSLHIRRTVAENGPCHFGASFSDTLPVGRDRPPGGPGEWKVNVGPWMDSRAFHGRMHSLHIRRTVAENGPCHFGASFSDTLPVGRDRPPGGPGEWKVNVGPWMDSRAFYGRIHSLHIRRTVAENGPCHFGASFSDTSAAVVLF